MFDGEYASLQALSAMQEVKVPEPIKVVKLKDGGAIFVMENLEITGRLSGQSGVLGQQLARLHLKNEEIAQVELKQEKYVHKGQQIKAVHNFGFHTTTCCGYIPQDNTWTYTWQEFFSRKIEQQISMLESEYGDREARDLWSQLLPRLSQLFDGLGEIKPALLHGDLWSGNVAEDKNGPVIFDPASFYGHAEYDLSISSLFGGFGQQFFKSYFSVIPKAPGYHERLELYKVFHYLNHWNHFGEAYKESSLGALRAVVKSVSM
ncbi:hypothetical protein C0Q70_08582 [Pomacea canaliculata]|uniref:protein-ribulosamine 3-kinase n=2 Tax=Pomacea canaliculata TaxID=400727 RepID=A0A2T7PI85_POMCA|nr:hypothetical protein C0Q70_08582 [Pomacea canaliculata]